MEPAPLPLLPILAIGTLLGVVLVWLVRRSVAGDATHLGGVHPNRPQNAPDLQPSRGPESVEDLIRSGNLIEAIKRVREATGLGLAEAKDRVDHFRVHGRWPEARAPEPRPPLPEVQGLEDLIRQGQMIQAIKLAREQNPGMDLKTAKALVEVLAARMR
jgi:ribosomal protein L7/L12